METEAKAEAKAEARDVCKGFKYLIAVRPLGMMYGSAGAFLSPENLVGRSGAKFPPDANTLSGVFFHAHYHDQEFKEELKYELFTAGPFWAEWPETNSPPKFYVPMPWHRIIGQNQNGKDDFDEWFLTEKKGEKVWQRKKKDLEPTYNWLRIDDWLKKTEGICQNKRAATSPWQYAPMLHPQMREYERSVLDEDGLFLENAVQLEEGKCLVYLSSHELKSGWYRFGGENHLAEIKSVVIAEDSRLDKLLKQPVGKAFATITPAVWGSTRYSYRYPQHEDFPKVSKMLTDRPSPYRPNVGGNLGRGRYAVPPGSVYILEEAIDKPWSQWDRKWFPAQKYPLQHLGSGLCLPITVEGMN